MKEAGTYLLFGPLRAYVHRAGWRKHAYIDPFSVIGVGWTIRSALRHAEKVLHSHFEGLVEEIQKHGADKVEFLTPLDDDEKNNASWIYDGYVAIVD